MAIFLKYNANDMIFFIILFKYLYDKNVKYTDQVNDDSTRDMRPCY